MSIRFSRDGLFHMRIPTGDMVACCQSPECVDVVRFVDLKFEAHPGYIEASITCPVCGYFPPYREWAPVARDWHAAMVYVLTTWNHSLDVDVEALSDEMIERADELEAELGPMSEWRERKCNSH